ncbi:MAG TPA: TonB-dependent receptor [Xanthomonadales bacterium]|nr:TonB-dependent receptor [Xanthomonadales bacterium]
MKSAKGFGFTSVWKIILLISALLFAVPGFAQDATDDASAEVAEAATDPAAAAAEDAGETDEDEADADEAATDDGGVELGKLVVTGSRLQRETYTSISPLQIITAEGSREAGLVNAADILQTSTAAGGQQIDLTFTGFVLDNGPGASTVDLRGLGAARTLVLLNGRRLAPSGVEGVPVAPDLNLIPSSLVRQYDVLLDGASSVYGSDAVAGVTNILMRKDFDGFEFDAFFNEPDGKNGSGYTINSVYGQNTDRGFWGIGVEFQDTDEVRIGDRPWNGAQCEQNYEITEEGQIRRDDQFYRNVFGMDWDECALGLLAARVSVPLAGSIYYTPGYSNGGWPNFSESNAFGFGVDGDGDGVTDISFRDYDLNGKPGPQNATLFPETDRLSIMGYGEYTFEGEMNNTLFFEAGYNNRDFQANFGEIQLFPTVPANNPYNICNPNAPGGVDCGLAYNAQLTNPNYVEDFGAFYGDLCAAFGLPIELCTPATFGLLSGPLGPRSTLPIVSVAGDRNLVSTNMEQYRIVLGMKGDLPAIDFGSMSGWIYEVAASWTESDGSSHRPGIRNDRLQLSLGAYSTTNTPCENNRGVVLAADAAPGCVPVNMFASSLYPVGTVVGDFATSAERNYLFDSRDFRTKYKQTLFSAYSNGFLFDLPGGTATGGLGMEYRVDDIKSIPDDVARDGLFFGFFSDGGAVGDKWTREVFGEIELPLLAGVAFAESLTVNLSGRWTDDELYGSDTTWSAKLGWRPVNSLLIRGTAGTSFRAPNVREVYLLNQTGFLNVTDPCVIPDGATDPITGAYNPALDTREQQVLDNCFRTGVDPTALDNSGFNTYSVEIARGGTPELEAETSDSYTYGFAWEQPFTEAFNLTFGATYYDIEISDTIVEPSPQFLVNDCYFDAELDSSFCDNLNRDADGFLSIIDARFINRDEARNRGIDFNANFDMDFNVGAQPIHFAADLVLNRNKEASETFLDDEGNPDFDDDHKEIGFPEWKGQLGLRFNVNDFRFTWVINYIGETVQDPDEVDEFGDVFGSNGFISDTCLGPPDDVLCRDFGDTDDYWLNSASLYWYGDTITVGAGIRNVFDESPPLVDGTEVLALNNVPIGYGYDLMGRTYFINVVWRP